MTIAVLVKQVPDTAAARVMDTNLMVLDRSASGAVLDEINERALAVALGLKEETGGDVVAVCMGPQEASDVLRRCLAVGADSAVHVTDSTLAGSDTVQTARVLAAALQRLNPDIVITGAESTDGSSGAVPAMIAELTGWGQATFLSTVRLEEGTVGGERIDEAGRWPITAQTPCVVSITEAAAEPKYPNLKGIMAAKKKPLLIWDGAELELAGFADEGPATEVIAATPRPPRASGVVRLDEGSAGLEIAAFLKEIEVL